MKSLRSSLTRGFTLVEVVLALGIATIGLVSILGLLNAATDADGDAGNDTKLVAMSDYVLNELHTVPFDALWTADPIQNWNVAPSMDTTPSDTVYYFSNEGVPIPASTVTSNPDFLYKCVVRKAADISSQNVLTGFYNQLKVQLDFYWPTSVGDEPLGKPAKKTLHASVARH
jgi:uncharacterized protein (TIGR02598 family)